LRLGTHVCQTRVSKRGFDDDDDDDQSDDHDHDDHEHNDHDDHDDHDTTKRRRSRRRRKRRTEDRGHGRGQRTRRGQTMDGPVLALEQGLSDGLGQTVGRSPIRSHGRGQVHPQGLACPPLRGVLPLGGLDGADRLNKGCDAQCAMHPLEPRAVAS
jgi:hypothetical protein